MALFVADALVPHAPVFLPPDFDARNANWWEVALRATTAGNERRGASSTAGSRAARKGASRDCCKPQIRPPAPPRQGVTDVYALGIAGWADQDVFIKELDGGLDAIASVLPIKDRTVRLINNRDNARHRAARRSAEFRPPPCTPSPQVMNKDEDVLVLMMTSHGEQTGFALQVPGKTVELTPQQVASALDGEGIKNRVVIVSACFSGIFVPPLANDNTIVMTAADAKNTSFGCAPERDWTYFGDAFFRQSLHPGSDFENAFDHARV